jgi:hopene-associated glycosyltransferase HpnB
VKVLVGLVAVLDVVWVYLTLFRGSFWRTRVRLGPESECAMWPSVVIIVPARDEEVTLARTLPRLLRQVFPGNARVVLVDDRSSDGTSTLAAAMGAETDALLDLTVVSGVERPEGWMGKVWALEQGRQAAGATDYLLLTDADIDHPADSLRRLVAAAEHGGFDMVSLMAKLRTVNRWERLAIPAFVYFFAQLYPFSWVNRRANRTAAAAGGCVLVRREALERVGAFEPIRGAVIEDVALARAFKRSGSRIWLGLADDVVSISSNDRLADLWDMVTRGAFTQIRNSTPLLIGSLAGLLFVYLLPVGAVVIGAVTGNLWITLLGVGAWVLMAVTYVPMLVYYGQWPGAALLLPFTASLFGAMTIDSARRHWFGKGISWKGRIYRPSSRP